MPIEKLMLTADEAAESLGVGRTTVYDLMRLGALQSVKIGRARRSPVSALRRFANQLSGEEIA